MTLLLRNFLLVAALVYCSASAADAQTPQASDDGDIQSWNEVTLSVPVNRSTDLYTAGTLWLGKNASRLQEARYSLGLTFKPFRNFTFTPFATAMKVRTFAGVLVPEYRINLRGVYRFPVKHFGLSHREHYEYRFRTSGNTWRYAPSITFEKAFPKNWVNGLKLFVTEEPFYDSASRRFSRNRFSVGINKILDPHLSFDLYYLHQGDNFSRPFDINVIGTALHIKL